MTANQIHKFFQVFNDTYDRMYNGSMPDDGWKLGLHFVQGDRTTAQELAKARGDLFFSDRELAAYAVAYIKVFYKSNLF